MIVNLPERARKFLAAAIFLSLSWAGIVSAAETPTATKTVEINSRITAQRGLIQLHLKAPSEKPSGEVVPLFSANGNDGSFLRIWARKRYMAVMYKKAGGKTAHVNFRMAKKWSPASVHQVEIAWQKYHDKLLLTLRADSQLAATELGEAFESFDPTCTIADSTVNKIDAVELLSFAMLPRCEFPPELIPGSHDIAINTDKTLGECYSFWHVANNPRTENLLQKNYLKYYHLNSPFIREINCIYLLGGRYEEHDYFYIGTDENGNVKSDFTDMLQKLRNVIAAKMTPRIVLDNVPYKMSDPAIQGTYGNTAPPADEKIWAEYVRQAMRALVAEFGAETVASWPIRVGTEPDLFNHWSGTAQQYMDHYDYTVDAVLSVLPQAKVAPGNILNPAATQLGIDLGDQWGLDIIDHAAVGTNAVTGKTGTPMHRFSLSWYGRVGAPLTLFDQAVNMIRQRLAKYPQFENIPIIVGEFTILGDELGRRLWASDTTEWAASFYAAFAQRVYALNVQDVYEWAQTTRQTYRPRTHVLEMLNKMAGAKRLDVQVNSTSQARCGAIATQKADGTLQLLVFNHRQFRKPSIAEKVTLRLNGKNISENTNWQMRQWTIDADHGVWAREFDADCAAAGVKRIKGAGNFEGSTTRLYGPEGDKIFVKNIEKYRKLAEIKVDPPQPVQTADGKLQLNFTMAGHSVRFIELIPQQ